MLNNSEQLRPNASLTTLIQLSFRGGGALDDLLHKYKDYQKTYHEMNEANKLWSVVVELQQVYIWVLFAVGFPTNLLAIFTILTMHTVTPAAALIATLAAFDGTALFAKLIGAQVPRHKPRISVADCKAEFLVLFLSTMANWILTFICVERYVTLAHPARRAIWLSKKVIFTAAVSVAATVFIIYASVSISMRDVDARGKTCGTLTEYIWFYKNIWFWINASLFLLIPCAVIIPCVVLTIVEIVRTGQRESGKAETTDDHWENQLSQRERRYQVTMATMMVVAAVVMVILCLPACVFFLTYKPKDNIYTEARWAVFEQIQYLLVDSTHAINFFVYFLSSRIFRHRLLYVLSCGRYKGGNEESFQELSAPSDEVKLQ